MGTRREHDFVTAHARRVVAAVAPEELAAFGAVAEAYRRDPGKVIAGRRRSDEVLGSGLDAMVTLVSPVALAVLSSVYTHLLNRAGEELSRRGEQGLGKLWRRIRRRPADEAGPDNAVPPFDQRQLEKVREVATARARALGLSEGQVDLLVVALVASLDGGE
ncbi:hypothetical protein GCM10010193_14820 [Kitasatospora atroaurantiaca]|uniref:Uncharacterized protein n=1 Tax=Kitasatospora atroaurantiaca TaxID=285545 RepID=A0A561EIC3_9ACTN|nr:hypothetical protein [Kitasatospora atroaurantiaca]TWE15370.1 hypothetical protein FB465_0263 [Kitasatospora atroaurantiaca]